jgi:FkbM family methyltransferase
VIVSYAQNAEDVLLWRALHETTDGFYLDVGAAHPTHDSVTKLFYEHGWRGINVEPHPEFFAQLCAERPRDLNLQLGVAASDGSLTFYENPNSPGSSTFDRELADYYRAQGAELPEHEIDVTTLAAICERHVDRPIDFLKIDVEGYEREVIAGADFERFRPRVLVVEAIDPKTHDSAAAEQWESLVVDQRYQRTFFDGLNSFYVREEDAELVDALSTPANYLDDYELFEHVETRERAARRVAELERSLADEGSRADAREAVLRQTRAALAAARTELNDVRAELTHARSTLISGLDGN